MEKISLEKIVLAIFFVVILYLGPGILFDHQIKHDFPFAYSASDAFQHQVRAEAVKDMGNFKYEASYISKGFENSIGRYPPSLYHLAVILSNSAGIEVYDSIYFVVVFFSIVAVFIMYFLIRDFNKTVALLSLPLTLLIFSLPVSIGFLWGHWPSVLSQSFLILLFWSIMRMNMKYSYILIALSLSATALTHTSETFFGIIALALFFGIKLLVRKLSKSDFKTMTYAGIIFLVVSIYYLIIFKFTWAKGSQYSFFVQPAWDGNPGFYIAGFGLILIPMIIGMIFAIPKLKNLHISLIFAFAMLLNGFLNYAGFEVRSFQIRFFWPIYLSVFLGFGIYALGKLVIKRWNFIYTFVLLVILIALFAGTINFPTLKQTDIQTIPYIPSLNRDSSAGMMNPFHWSALTWLSETTPQPSSVYFFYGDIYGQDALLRNAKRFHYQIITDDFIASIQDRKIKRFYESELPGDSGGSITNRPSFFTFEQAALSKPSEYFYGLQDICAFDYVVLDKVSGQQVFAQYNIIIANELLQNDYVNIAFENEVTIILKNNNLGADCIAERSF
jgi:hypothetical protein